MQEPVESEHIQETIPFVMLEKPLILDTTLTPGARFVYMLLKTLAGPDGCFPGIETIAAYCGYSKPTVHKYLDELADHGWIERKARGQGKTNLYTLKAERLSPRLLETQRAARRAKILTSKSKKSLLLDVKKTDHIIRIRSNKNETNNTTSSSSDEPSGIPPHENEILAIASMQAYRLKDHDTERTEPMGKRKPVPAGQLALSLDGDAAPQSAPANQPEPVKAPLPRSRRYSKEQQDAFDLVKGNYKVLFKPSEQGEKGKYSLAGKLVQQFEPGVIERNVNALIQRHARPQDGYGYGYVYKAIKEDYAGQQKGVEQHGYGFRPGYAAKTTAGATSRPEPADRSARSREFEQDNSATVGTMRSKRQLDTWNRGDNEYGDQAIL